VGEDHDAVGGEGDERVVDGLRRLGFSHFARRVHAFLLQALDRLGLRLLGLGDRIVGIGDPEGQLGLVGGGREHEHLGALDLVAEGLAQEGGVDRFRCDDEQFHAVRATPASVA